MQLINMVIMHPDLICIKFTGKDHPEIRIMKGIQNSDDGHIMMVKHKQMYLYMKMIFVMIILL